MESIQIGESYKVIELEKYGGKIKLDSRKFRELENDEILVKVICTTIHPADMFFLRGQYGAEKPKTPLVPGIEGSGLIVAAGKNVDQSLVGKRCGVAAESRKPGQFEGLWSQYIYTVPRGVLIFDGEIDYETICFTIGNPLTAVGFLDTLRKRGVTAVGQNGASSAIGKIFIRLCKREGIKTVNVVRKEEQVEALKSIGADFVLNSTDKDFDEKLKKTLEENNVKDFFECVGGDMTAKIINLLPPQSIVYHFGNLEFKRLDGFSTSDFIFYGKVLKGWWLVDWFKNTPINEIIYWRNYIVQDLTSGSDVFKTTVSKNFPIEEFEKAFEYYMQNMSEGKIILRPHESI